MTILFFKAQYRGDTATPDLFSGPVRVEGYTRKDGVFVRPHVATRNKRQQKSTSKAAARLGKEITLSRVPTAVVRHKASAVRDLRGERTGWLEWQVHDAGVPTAKYWLIHPTKDQVIEFPGSAYAQSYAIDNPATPIASDHTGNTR